MMPPEPDDDSVSPLDAADAAASGPAPTLLTDRRKQARPGDRGPVPQVHEGNTVTDWDLWEEMVYQQEIRDFVAQGFGGLGGATTPAAAVALPARAPDSKPPAKTDDQAGPDIAVS